MSSVSALKRGWGRGVGGIGGGGRGGGGGEGGRGLNLDKDTEVFRLVVCENLKSCARFLRMC